MRQQYAEFLELLLGPFVRWTWAICKVSAPQAEDPQCELVHYKDGFELVRSALLLSGCLF
mgnify:FL=1